MLKILIIDDDPIVRTALKRTLQNQGYDTTVASNGVDGITQAQQICPALIICDWMMSELDGLSVCRRIKADPELATTFFILLTARGAAKGEEEDRVKGLDAGADEFVSKPIEMNELKARVRAGLRLYQLNQDLQRQKQALEVLNQTMHSQKQILEAELTEAADYVRSLLPKELLGEVTTEALFIPSIQLGGDCFDYHWIDDDHLAIYLLDVSGHGVGSALLSVSVLNVLRSPSLCNYLCQPSIVLKILNHTFQMSNHGDKYFTIWYGVYHRHQRQLVYANAGHPPAVLLSCTSQATIEMKKLDSLSLPIGVLPDAEFDEETLAIAQSSILYIFSDGVYEIHQPDGKIWGIEALIELLKNSSNLQQVKEQLKILNINATFDDDLSLLKVNFG